jgi:hypothetical protein
VTVEQQAPAHLRWLVKRSFLDYVQGSGGTMSCGAPAWWSEDGFCFPLLEDARSGADRVLGYGGEALFRAHGGMLSVLVDLPAIRLGVGRAELSIDSAGGVIAHLEPIAEGMFRPILTELGSSLFEGAYGVDTALEPLAVIGTDL